MARPPRPGVFVSETIAPAPIQAAASPQSIGATIGVTPRGPTSVQLVDSWAQFAGLYGSVSGSYPLTIQAYQFFVNGGSQLAVRRVTSNESGGTGVASASVQLYSDEGGTVQSWRIVARGPGAWGNGLGVQVSQEAAGTVSLTVSHTASGSRATLDRFSGLSANPDHPRYFPTVVGSSQFVSVAEWSGMPALPHVAPGVGGSLATGPIVMLEGGQDGENAANMPGGSGNLAAYSSVVREFDEIPRPKVLFLPDGVPATAVATVLAETAPALNGGARSDIFYVGTAAGATAVEALAYAQSLGSAEDYAALYWPRIVVADPVSSFPGATRTVEASGSIAGRILANDFSRGVFKAPAGVGARLAGAVAAAKPMSNADVEYLFNTTTPVNAVRAMPGAGVCVMGARTVGSNGSVQHVNVRRTLTFLRASMEAQLTQFLFENNDAITRQVVQGALTGFLYGFWERGGLAGANSREAFRVRCDGGNNPAASIMLGELHVEVGVALQYPAEFILIDLIQTNGTVA